MSNIIKSINDKIKFRKRPENQPKTAVVISSSPSVLHRISEVLESSGFDMMSDYLELDNGDFGLVVKMNDKSEDKDNE